MKTIEEIKIKTPLAEHILENILMGFQTYESLEKTLSKDRNTIGQSIKKILIKNHYVSEERVKGKSKSKKVSSFNPTSKGVYYGIAFFELYLDKDDLDEVFEQHSASSSIGDMNGFRNLLKNSASWLLQCDMFDKGELKLSTQESSFNMGWEAGDFAGKAGTLITDQFASSTSEAIEMLKKTIPPSFSNHIVQLIDQRKDTTNKKYDEIIKNFRTH